MGAALWAGPEAVVSGRAAAHLWRMGFPSTGRIEVTVPRGVRLPHRNGVIVRETKAWDLIDRQTRFGIPVAGPARTVLDVCAWGTDLDGLRALDEARRLGLVQWPELWECLIRHACRGRNGIRRFRRVLVRRHGRKAPGGEFARLFLVLLDEMGVLEPQCEYEVWADGHHYFIDLAYPELMVAIELDDSSHLTEKALEEDPIRQERLERAGWQVIRFTWREFIDEPMRVLARLRAVLASAAAPLGAA